jgi:hypothetical protein
MSATLPTLTHTGEHPAWDAYLTSIYGQPLRNGTSDFPIDLSSFTFFHWSAPFGRRNKLHIACGAPDGCSRHSCKPLCGQIYGSVLRPLNSSRLGFFVAHALTPAPITDPSTGEQSIEVIRYHEPGESADSGVWYNGVVGSGIWLALGRVLDISCLVTPYRLPHERPASASIGHNLSCAVPSGVREADSNPRPFALLEPGSLCPLSLQSAEGRTFESRPGRERSHLPTWARAQPEVTQQQKGAAKRGGSRSKPSTTARAEGH